MTNAFHCSACVSHQPEVFGSGAVVDSLAAIPGKAKGEETRQGENKVPFFQARGFCLAQPSII